MIVSHDGGNGFMKDQIDDQRFIFPSILAEVLPGQDIETVDINDLDNVKDLLQHFLEKMDITVNSETLNSSGRYLVGQQATYSINDPINFNVNSVEGKSTSDISLICIFALIAYSAVRDFVKEKNYVPDDLNVTIDKLSTALPIDEIKLPGVQKAFARRFTAYTHEVVINSFSEPVSVKLHFPNVFIDPEGVAAVTGLIFDSKTLSYRHDGIFSELRENYNLPNFSGHDIITAGNVLIIDIGDGTIDFAVTNKGLRIANQNRSLLTGVGNVIENAITAVRKSYPMIPPMDRQTFIEIASRTDSKEGKVYQEFLKKQTIILERQIIEQLKDFQRSLHGQIGMIVVCGGGASLLKNEFQATFKSNLTELFPLSDPLLLWVAPKYTQFLNLDGLVVRAKLMK